MVPDCGIETAAVEYQPTPQTVLKQPELELFCLKHFKSLMADRRARAAAHKVQCRHDGCTDEGALYPGGRWCREHAPLNLPVRRVRSVETVELPVGNNPLGDFDEKSELEIRPVVPGAISTEAVLYSTELAIDDERLPRSVLSALKTATEHGWNAKATIACSSEDMFSVLVKFRHSSGKQLTTRHEQPGGKPMGFKVGWLQYTPTGLPNKVGWREAMAFLKGEDPLDDRPALIEAMNMVMDIGGEVVRVDVTG